ncbi:hypothetical protein BU16DRAFT_521340 [Lophium mytilinum]|uniref:Uncharacterized protein n=1 Tax=Lophium mytilinum TaxID=390894 RepID=A0A6A6RDI1_9PEZI|nr:hypothetical protein BU16DRAFT_521340 [Lophium mytilinum]
MPQHASPKADGQPSQKLTSHGPSSAHKENLSIAGSSSKIPEIHTESVNNEQTAARTLKDRFHAPLLKTRLSLPTSHPSNQARASRYPGRVTLSKAVDSLCSSSRLDKPEEDEAPSALSGKGAGPRKVSSGLKTAGGGAVAPSLPSLVFQHVELTAKPLPSTQEKEANPQIGCSGSQSQDEKGWSHEGGIFFIDRDSDCDEDGQ